MGRGTWLNIETALEGERYMVKHNTNNTNNNNNNNNNNSEVLLGAIIHRPVAIWQAGILTSRELRLSSLDVTKAWVSFSAASLVRYHLLLCFVCFIYMCTCLRMMYFLLG